MLLNFDKDLPFLRLAECKFYCDILTNNSVFTFIVEGLDQEIGQSRTFFASEMDRFLTSFLYSMVHSPLLWEFRHISPEIYDNKHIKPAGII